MTSLATRLRARTGAAPTGTIHEEIEALSPTLYMRMNQTGTDNPIDSSSNAYTMLLQGTYTWGGTGPDGHGALSVGGAADIQRSGTVRMAMTGDQTRLAFVKMTSSDSTRDYDGNAALTLFGDTTNDVWDSFGVTGGKADFTRFNNTSWQHITSTSSVNDGAWHMIAATYNSSTRAVEIYVDGADDGGGTITAHQAKGGVNFWLVGFTSGDKFDGDCAHLALFNSVLTSTNISDIWAARNP